MKKVLYFFLLFALVVSPVAQAAPVAQVEAQSIVELEDALYYVSGGSASLPLVYWPGGTFATFGNGIYDIVPGAGGYYVHVFGSLYQLADANVYTDTSKSNLVAIVRDGVLNWYSPAP